SDFLGSVSFFDDGFRPPSWLIVSVRPIGLALASRTRRPPRFHLLQNTGGVSTLPRAGAGTPHDAARSGKGGAVGRPARATCGSTWPRRRLPTVPRAARAVSGDNGS